MNNKLQEGLQAKLAIKAKRKVEREKKAKGQQHSPGPWRIHPKLINERYVVITSDAVDRVAVTKYFGNAKLMSAAPELFIVARAYVELAESVQTLEADTNPGLRDALKFARDTIAKAEGRAS